MVRDTVMEMYIRISIHGVAEMVKLELLEMGEVVGVLQLAVIPDTTTTTRKRNQGVV